MPIILKVEKLVKKFGGLIANNNIDMNVEEGTILGLIGPNGAGKTTFFNCISGFCKIDSGKITYKDKNISNLQPNRICKLGIARTFQVVKDVSNMSVLESVMCGAFCRTWNPSKAKKIALETLKFGSFDLYEKKNLFINNLTLIDKKALQIVVALATKPRILMLDEAMAGLTKNEQVEAIKLIKKIRDSGITLIIVEHVMEIIMAIADKIIVISSGEKIAEGIPKEIANNPNVVKAYLGG